MPSQHTLDIRIDRAFRLNPLTVSPSIDIFNALNANTILARRIQRNSPAANDISGIVAPRVIRFGDRATW